MVHNRKLYLCWRRLYQGMGTTTTAIHFLSPAKTQQEPPSSPFSAGAGVVGYFRPSLNWKAVREDAHHVSCAPCPCLGAEQGSNHFGNLPTNARSRRLRITRGVLRPTQNATRCPSFRTSYCFSHRSPPPHTGDSGEARSALVVTVLATLLMCGNGHLAVSYPDHHIPYEHHEAIRLWNERYSPYSSLGEQEGRLEGAIGVVRCPARQAQPDE